MGGIILEYVDHTAEDKERVLMAKIPNLPVKSSSGDQAPNITTLMSSDHYHLRSMADTAQGTIIC